MFPLHPEKKNGLEKNGPRKIKTHIDKHFNGSKVHIKDVYKPNGIKSERSAALREDIFDLTMISASPCTLPWSPERLQRLRHFYPTLPLACIDAQELKTVDVSILNAPDAPADLSTNLSNRSTCRDMVPNTSNALTNDDITIEYRQFRLAYEKSEKSQFWSISYKLLTESAESLNQFALSLRDYLYKQKDVSKRKNTIVCRLLGMLLPNLFSKDRDETQVDVQCLLMLNNPQDLLVKIRQLLKCPFVKATILPSRLELSIINRRMNDLFRTMLEPPRTHTGFRVNLVNFVKFVAFHVYGKNSISGLRIDNYGDAMSRGKRDVVRMAFRILDTGIETEQSSTHVFTFAVFDVNFWLTCFPICFMI